jgi:hypothetical protein
MRIPLKIRTSLAAENRDGRPKDLEESREFGRKLNESESHGIPRVFT